MLKTAFEISCHEGAGCWKMIVAGQTKDGGSGER